MNTGLLKFPNLQYVHSLDINATHTHNLSGRAILPHLFDLTLWFRTPITALD